MIRAITALELVGVKNYHVYMRQSTYEQLIGRIETPKAEQNEPTEFMQEIKNLGIKTRRDDAAKKICAKADKQCDHSCCFGITCTLLEKTLLAVWQTAKKLYGQPKVIRILINYRGERPVFDWTPDTLSYHLTPQAPVEYVPALKKLKEFRSIETQAGRDGKPNRIIMTVAPGITLEKALGEAGKVLTAY